MPKAVFNGETIASCTTGHAVVDGYTYFPMESIKKEYLKTTATSTSCAWKGACSYYSVAVKGKESVDAAWEYKSPKPAAVVVKGKVAFWKDVQVSSLEGDAAPLTPH